ncbi:MAG: two-component regulator propeller domain-containing protein, partial [Calditrichaceae bacterium]
FPWDGSQYKFKDFYKNFDIIPNKVTKIQLFADKIWLGTDRGLFCAPSDINKYTINDPTLWDMYTSESGFPTDNILEVTIIEDRLWIGTSRGIVTIDASLNVQVESAFGLDIKDAVTDIIKNQDNIYIANNYPSSRLYNLYEYDPDLGRTLIQSFKYEITCFQNDPEDNLWIGLDNLGIYLKSTNSYIKQDGPGENAIRYIIKDAEENIWASSGRFKLTPNEGFFIFNGEYWTNFDFRSTGWSDLGNTDIILRDPYDNIWLGSWGGGAMVSRNEEFEFFHSYDNSGILDITTYQSNESITLDPNPLDYRGFFSGTPANSRYEVIGTIALDSYGRLWFANYFAANSNKYVAIAPFSNNGFISLNKEDWYYFGANKGLTNLEEGEISCIAFNDFYQAFVGTFSNGLYVFDYQDKNNVINIKSFSTQENLYNNRILSLCKDQDGIMWIGTSSGLNSYDGVNLYRHVGDSESEDLNKMYGPVGNQINQIFVDQANNKWFATSGGLSILRGGRSPWDSTAWMGLTTENSGLVDNNVNTVFVDPEKSEALIGTEKGLSIYHGRFAEIQEKYDKMIGGPNPFILSKENSTFIIRNLLYNSEVKILTLNGKLIRRLTVENESVDGGRAEWDGRDTIGNKVASGIYLYFAFAEDGNSKAGKVAVIR